MKITIEAEPKEVAELVLALQKQSKSNEIHYFNNEPVFAVTRDEIHRETREAIAREDETT